MHVTPETCPHNKIAWVQLLFFQPRFGVFRTFYHPVPFGNLFDPGNMTRLSGSCFKLKSMLSLV